MGDKGGKKDKNKDQKQKKKRQQDKLQKKKDKQPTTPAEWRGAPPRFGNPPVRSGPNPRARLPGHRGPSWRVLPRPLHVHLGRPCRIGGPVLGGLGIEGRHNNHHVHQRSARHGTKWYEFDPTWLTPKLLEGARVVRNVHTVQAVRT